MTRTVSHPVSSLPEISICFPAFNDEHTIAQLIQTAAETAARITSSYELIVTNDGSRDGTGDILENLRVKFPALRIIHHTANQGYGAALQSAFAYAALDWIFYTDGDGQYDPRELQLLVDQIRDGVDVVNGYKIRRQDILLRRFTGQIWRHFTRTAFGIRIRDVNCDFRLFRRRLLDGTRWTSRSGAFGLELVRLFQEQGAEIVEVPIHHFPRRHGTSQFFHMRHLLATAHEITVLWRNTIRPPERH